MDLWKIIFAQTEERANSDSQQNTTYLYIICGLFMCAIFMIDLAVIMGIAIPVLYVGVVLISLQSPQKKFTVFVSVVSSILVFVGLLFSPSAGLFKTCLLNRLISLLAIWITAFLSLQRKLIEEERKKAVGEREKAMEELT